MKNGNTIIIELGRVRNVVIGRFIQFPEELRGTGNIPFDGDGMEVDSDGVPEFGRDILYCPGNERNFDSRIIYREMPTEQDAENYVDQIKATIAAFNATWKEKEPAESGSLTLKMERVE